MIGIYFNISIKKFYRNKEVTIFMASIARIIEEFKGRNSIHSNKLVFTSDFYCDFFMGDLHGKK